MIAVGDPILVRSAVTATHLDAFLDVLPSSDEMTLAGIDIVRIAHSKLVDHIGTMALRGWSRRGPPECRPAPPARSSWQLLRVYRDSGRFTERSVAPSRSSLKRRKHAYVRLSVVRRLEKGDQPCTSE